jgi:hypothetical protein
MIVRSGLTLPLPQESLYRNILIGIITITIGNSDWFRESKSALPYSDDTSRDACHFCNSMNSMIIHIDSFILL